MRILAVALALAATVGAFEEPGGLYVLELPEGFEASTHVDLVGRAFCRFTGPGGRFEIHTVTLPAGVKPDPKAFKEPAVCRDDTAFLLRADKAVAATARAAFAKLRAPPVVARHPAPGKEAEPSDVVEQLAKSTPLIWAAGKQGQVGTGSGFVINEEGYGITNRHVVAPPGMAARNPFDPLVVTYDHTVTKKSYRAEVVAISKRYDLALIKLDQPGPFAVFPLAHGKQVEGGHNFLVMGWPAPDRFGTTAISANEGTLAAVLRDLFGRPSEYRLGGGRTAQGNSGGPVFDLKTGGVLGALYEVRYHDHHGGPAKGGFREALYQAAVPARWILWEFPQAAARGGQPASAAQIASFAQQGRYGAAMLACRAILKTKPDDGYAHAFMFRIYSRFGDRGRARDHLLKALRDKRTRYVATLFAGEAALEAADLKDARGWARRLHEMQPSRDEAAMLNGRIDLAAGQWKQADLAFTRARAPGMRGVALVRAQMQKGGPMTLSHAMRAEELLQEGIESRPYGANVLYAHLALLRHLSGASDQDMAASIERALACEPHDPLKVFLGQDRTVAEFGTRDHDALLAIADLLIRKRALNEVPINMISRALSVRVSSHGLFTQGRYWIRVAGAALKAGQKQAGAKALELAIAAFKQATQLDTQTIWGLSAAAVLKELQK